MNSIICTRIIGLALFAALSLPLQLAAQNEATPHHPHQYHHYQINDVGTFGGPNSSYVMPAPGGRLLNNSGAAVGNADTATPDPNCFGDCFVSHAFKWQGGVTHELEALPGFNGLNSAIGLWVSDGGLTAGFSTNGIDPLTGGPAFEAVLWGKDGSLTDLGTFGGNDGVGNAINNRGQVAGAALNAIPDPYAGVFSLPGATQAHAFLWTRSAGLQDLGTLGGTGSAAFLINQPGQIAGWSFTNTIVNPTTGIPTLDPFLWDKTAGMIDLGTLGGTTGQAYALNNRGQVVGQSNTQGDLVCHAFLWDKTAGMRDLGTLGGEDAVAIWLNDAGDVVGQAGLPGSASCNQWPMHAFLWRKGVMTDLGSLDGIQFSTALSINAKGQIVGNVGDAVLATLWEDGGPLVDLNTLIPSNPGLVLFNALYINDRGEIAAQAVLPDGDIHSIVLIPCDENHLNVAGCDYSLVDAATAALVNPSAAIRQRGVLTPTGSAPGMLNQFRSPSSRRTQRPGTVALPKVALPTTKSDWLDDHKLSPYSGNPFAHCEIRGGVLTGRCIDAPGGNNCALTSIGCLSGLPATSLGSVTCFSGAQLEISTIQCPGVVNPTFLIETSALTPATVSPGGSSTATASLTALAGFNDLVALTCSVTPAATPTPTCAITPSSITPGTSATLTVRTTSPSSASLHSPGSGLIYALWLPLFGLVATGAGFTWRRKAMKGKLVSAAFSCVVLAGLVFQSACGSNKPGTPPGAYTVTLTGTDASIPMVQSATVTFTVQ